MAALLVTAREPLPSKIVVHEVVPVVNELTITPPFLVCRNSVSITTATTRAYLWLKDEAKGDALRDANVVTGNDDKGSGDMPTDAQPMSSLQQMIMKTVKDEPSKDLKTPVEVPTPVEVRTSELHEAANLRVEVSLANSNFFLRNPEGGEQTIQVEYFLGAITSCVLPDDAKVNGRPYGT